jgi:hypothetical protein
MFDVCQTWSPTTPFAPCDLAPESRGGDVTLDPGGSPYTYDTDADTLEDSDSNPVDHASMSLDGGGILWTTASLDIPDGSVLRAVGSKPLLIASWSSMTVSGTIDVSSSLDGGNGAGANAACGLAAGTSANGNSGGGGGGFLSAGGGGGGGTMAGVAISLIPDPGLRGGCPGGNGGHAIGDVAPGGSGGGAIALSARTQLSVSGTLFAGGGGGGAGVLNTIVVDTGGGGGGGSGGLIWLDSGSIVLTSATLLAAGGGGGGEGGDDNEDGNPGNPAPADSMRAQGGHGGANQGGDGGNGAPKSATDWSADGGKPGNAGSADGGGGGGSGLIRFSRLPAGLGAATVWPTAPPPF